MLPCCHSSVEAVRSPFRPAFRVATIADMHLPAYWRWNSNVRNLCVGAGFNFNSKQSRLHSAIEVGETLWLFTVLKAPPRYFPGREAARPLEDAQCAGLVRSKSMARHTGRRC
jgi:hypothetical protein